MAESSELKIIITADDKASGVLQNNKKGLLDLGSIAGGALKLGLGLAAGGTAALTAGLFTSVKAASEAEDVQADLAATLLSTKSASGMTLDALNALATGFQNTTRFEDDTTLKGEAMLLTFTNIGADVFPMATEAMLNMGQKFGSVDAAALQLGKALNDPIAGVGALRRVGVQLTDQQEAQIKSLMALGDVQGAQKIILGELQTEFGGLAVAAGQTLSGKLDILKNKFGDIQEKIGGAMLPGLTKLGEALIKTLDNPIVTKAIDSITNWLAAALPKAIDTGAGLLNTLSTKGVGGVLSSIAAWVNDPKTQAALQAAGTQIGKGAMAGIQAAMTNAPAWTAMSIQMGKVAGPTLANAALGVGYGFWAGVFEAIMPGFKAKDFKPLFNVPGFANGGIVPGPLGAPQLVVAHGGETFTPAGGGGGAGSGGLTFVYAPVISLADEREAAQRMMPVLDRWWANAKRTRTA